jgi:hypothetical protein
VIVLLDDELINQPAVMGPREYYPEDLLPDPTDSEDTRKNEEMPGLNAE